MESTQNGKAITGKKMKADSANNEELTVAQKRKKKIVREIKSIAIIALVVFAFRSVFFEPFKIPSGSMIPTLMIGDFILVNKFAYGIRVPFTDTQFSSKSIYIFGQSGPKRGDVIVFKYPGDKKTNYIKRVIGLPGDEIEIINKVIYVNGKAIQRTEVTHDKVGKKILGDMDDKFTSYKLKVYQAKTGEHTHHVQYDEQNAFKTDYDKRKVPPGHYFVMGDNRDFSYDSRFWGFVPFDYIKGRAIAVWFSMIMPWEGTTKFRGHRIGTVID